MYSQIEIKISFVGSLRKTKFAKSVRTAKEWNLMLEIGVNYILL